MYFSSLRSNHIKGNYRISCHLLTFWPEERGSFCRTISGTRAHETSRCNISTKSRSQQDKDAYREVCNNYSMSLKNAKQRYYSDLIEECGGDTRKLFQVVRSLSNKPEENQLPPHDDPCKLADDFGEFFCRKVDLIRNDIDAITVVPPVLNVPTPENKFEKFDVLSEEEVSDIIMGSSNASCQLDPIPTWLLKLCGSELIPVITKMINLSKTSSRQLKSCFN